MVRENIDSYHKKWFDAAVALGQKVNASDPQLPRRCVRQTARSNVPGDTPEVYFRCSLTAPFLDELINHIDQRFSDIQQKVIRGLSIVPSVIKSDSYSNSNLNELTEFYHDYVPNPVSLDAELELWKIKWCSYYGDLPDTPAKALHFANPSMYPNIHCLLRVICTIPVTSCECEQSVSVLRLKTYLRSTMGQERLSGLALMHFNYGMHLNFGENNKHFCFQA